MFHVEHLFHVKHCARPSTKKGDTRSRKGNNVSPFWRRFLPIYPQDGVEEEEGVEGDHEETFPADEGVFRPGEAPDQGTEGNENDCIGKIFPGESHRPNGGCHP